MATHLTPRHLRGHSGRSLRLLAAFAVLGTLGATIPASAAATDRPGSAGYDGVRLNHIQVIGTHNSYHLEPTPKEKAVRAAVNPAGESELEYSHAPLDQQLDRQAVRHIELDVFADPDGGRYATPLLRRVAGEPEYDPVMKEPGTKVLHIQDVDYHSNCLTLVRCLRQVREWSDEHRGHVPVAIQVEFKDGPIVVPGQPTVEPLKWTRERMLALEREIASVFPARRTITPDDVRRPRLTLEQSVLARGWPTLRESRGQVMFLMDNAGTYRQEYLRGNPSLQGRTLFTSSEPGQPDAAFVKRNDPLGANTAVIGDLVRRGYVVRTRADLPTVQARSGDTTMRDAALASGAQWVSTDFPVPGMAARFGTGYFAALPTDTVARCNPVSAPVRCRDGALDRS